MPSAILPPARLRPTVLLEPTLNHQLAIASPIHRTSLMQTLLYGQATANPVMIYGILPVMAVQDLLKKLDDTPGYPWFTSCNLKILKLMPPVAFGTLVYSLVWAGSRLACRKDNMLGFLGPLNCTSEDHRASAVARDMSRRGASRMRDYPSTSRYEDSKPEQSWNKPWRMRLKIKNEAAKELYWTYVKEACRTYLLKEQCENSHPAVSSHHCDDNYGMHCCT